MNNKRLQIISDFLKLESNSEFDRLGGFFNTDYGVSYHVDKTDPSCSDTDLCRLCLSSDNPILLFSTADLLGIFNYKCYTKIINGVTRYYLDDNKFTVFNSKVMVVICGIKDEVISKSLSLLESEEYKPLFDKSSEDFNEYRELNYIRSLFLKDKTSSRLISNIKYR